MPKISVIIPVYNVEKYLRECLESVVNQTLDDIEIICINDGSTDSSLAILQEYSLKDNRIKIINKENSGYGASVNLGLEGASGEYIAIVESDDFVKNSMFEQLYKIATENNADIVKSDYFYYSTLDKKARKAGKISKFRTKKAIHIKQYLKLLKMPPTIWSAIYKREFLNKNKIRFLETKGASFQDTSFSFKVLSLADRIVLTDKSYLYYRQDNSSSSVHSSDKVFAICLEYDEITKFLNENILIKNFANTQKLIKQYNAYMWNLMRIDEKFRDLFIEKFSTTFLEFYESGEINSKFYQKVKKRDFELLLRDKNKFRLQIDKVIDREKFNDKRRKLFSVRINPSRVSVVIFGKQILEIS